MFWFEPGKSLFQVDSYALSQLWEFDAATSDANVYTMYTTDKQWRIHLFADGGFLLNQYLQDDDGGWEEFQIEGDSLRSLIGLLLGSYIRGQGYFDNPKDWP